MCNINSNRLFCLEYRGLNCYGQWLYGYPIMLENHNNKVYIAIIPKDEKTCVALLNDLQVVLFETVGAYTGFVDIYGKKIFEDDIVKFTDSTFKISHIGNVCFHEGSFCICYDFYGSNRFHRIGQTSEWQDMGASGVSTFCYEVIGSVFNK